MILSALSFITTELNDYLTSAYQTTETKAVLSALVQPNGTAVADIADKMSVILINLEPESTVRNLQPERGGEQLRQNPAVKLNLRVLFAANFNNYEEALKFLGSTLAFFQGHGVFTPQNAPRLGKQFDRLVVELESTNYQEWSYLWGMAGTKAMPAVVYKVKMVAIQDGAAQGRQPTVGGVGTSAANAIG